ncbi:MAG: L-aspartate oxidase [Bacteriovoracia bacterium]
MRVNSDFIVLGSGIAGLSFALKAASLGKVLILTKAKASEGATQYAQGGIAAVFSKSDSFESHILDTVDAGSGLCKKKVVDFTVREGPQRVQELIDLGVAFTKKQEKLDTTDAFPYALAKEGGHHQRRILHSHDSTGRAILTTLLEQAKKNPNIEIREHHVGIDLILQNRKSNSKKPKRCIGVYALDTKSKNVITFGAKFVVLATGGAGKVYLYTTNPDTSTGDAISMSYRAGARVGNLEFMQFHPTCLFHPQAKTFLISEALRGEGGILRNSKGEAFMKKYHEMENLAPRDVVARAIDSEMKKNGSECVHLDMSHLESSFLKERFPNIYETCLRFGIDMTKTPIPVVPAAHYMCGGIVTDENAETTIPSLFAIGEAAYTGLHGANRLASNSLLEAVVFSARAFEAVKARLHKEKQIAVAQEQEHLPTWDTGMAVPIEEQINISHTWKEIRTLMWNYVGIVRSTRRLEKAAARLALIHHEVNEYYWKYLLTTDLIELRNLVTLSDLIVQSALLRKESRGLHYNIDYPLTDDQYFKRDTIL